MIRIRNQQRRHTSSRSASILGLALASGFAVGPAIADDGVVFLGIDRSDEAMVDGIVRSNRTTALDHWQDLTSISKRHPIRASWSTAEAEQDSSADARSAEAVIRTDALAATYDAAARSDFVYHFLVRPLAHRDCTQSYDGFGSTVLEEAFDQAADGWGYSGPMTTARISFRYDVDYQGDLSKLTWSSGEAAGLYRGSALIDGTSHGAPGNGWYRQYLEPGSYSIEAHADITASRPRFRNQKHGGSCEIDLGFDIEEGPGRAKSTLLDVSRAASARPSNAPSDEGTSTSLAGPSAVAVQNGFGTHASASETIDGTNNAFWGRHLVTSRASRWIQGVGAAADSSSSLVFQVPGSSSSITQVVIAFKGLMASEGTGQAVVRLEVFDSAGRVHLDEEIEANRTEFGSWDSEQSHYETLSLPGGRYTFRITSEAWTQPTFGMPLGTPEAEIDCSFAVIMN